MAKGIEKVAVRFAVEVAVYWGNPQPNGHGGYIFDAPVEIPCRWENKREVMLGASGREFTCNASLLLTQDVDLQGYMWRGTLADLQAIPGVDLTRPNGIDDAFMINRFDRIPMVRKDDEFVRICYLYYYGRS